MDKIETIEIDRFWAEAENNELFTIIITQDVIVSRLQDGTPSRIPVPLKKVRTSKGYSVNFIDDNTYKIVELGLVVKKVNKV
jgi:hypothetical protein